MNGHIIAEGFVHTEQSLSVHQRPVNDSKPYLWPYMEYIHDSEQWYAMRLQFLMREEMERVSPHSFSWILRASANLSSAARLPRPASFLATARSYSRLCRNASPFSTSDRSLAIWLS